MTESQGVTGAVKVVLVAIFVFVLYVTWGAYVDGREARRLADLGPCGLAQAYVGWRVDSEGGLGAAAGTHRADADAFRRRSAAFANAARLAAAGSVPAAHAPVVEGLHALASRDTDPANAAGASADAFLEAFFEACPAESVDRTARFVD
jgi:hypothetical protein